MVIFIPRQCYGAHILLWEDSPLKYTETVPVSLSWEWWYGCVWEMLSKVVTYFTKIEKQIYTLPSFSAKGEKRETKYVKFYISIQNIFYPTISLLSCHSPIFNPYFTNDGLCRPPQVILYNHPKGPVKWSSLDLVCSQVIRYKTYIQGL